MARRTPRPEATQTRTLIPLKEHCDQCGQPLSVANHGHRSVATLSGQWRLTLAIRQCVQPDCPNYHKRQRPEEEGRWALSALSISLSERCHQIPLRGRSECQNGVKDVA